MQKPNEKLYIWRLEYMLESKVEPNMALLSFADVDQIRLMSLFIVGTDRVMKNKGSLVRSYR